MSSRFDVSSDSEDEQVSNSNTLPTEAPFLVRGGVCVPWLKEERFMHALCTLGADGTRLSIDRSTHIVMDRSN